MLPRFRGHPLRPRSHDIAARASSFAAASPRDAAMSKRPPPSPTGSFDNASERDAADSGEEQDSRDTPGVSLECPGVSLECRKGVGCSEVHLVSLTNQTLDVWKSFGEVLGERLKVDVSQELATEVFGAALGELEWQVASDLKLLDRKDDMHKSI